MKTYGEQTRPTIFLTIESHKLHKEFLVPQATPVRFSQPVKLTPDGEVVPLAPGDNRNLCIGVSIHNSVQNPYGSSQVTVLMKGFSTILCQASDDVVAGPVQLSGFENVVGPNDPEGKTEAWYGLNTVEQAAATDADIFGWAIEPAEEGGPVEVVIF